MGSWFGLPEKLPSERADFGLRGRADPLVLALVGEHLQNDSTTSTTEKKATSAISAALAHELSRSLSMASPFVNHETPKASMANASNQNTG